MSQPLNPSTNDLLCVQSTLASFFSTNLVFSKDLSETQYCFVLSDMSQSTIALIHYSCLPSPLGTLSKAISTNIQQEYFGSRLPSNYNIEVVDIADFDLPTLDGASKPELQTGVQSEGNSHQPKKSATDWAAEISKHSGFIILFPYHTWSHCTPVKSAMSLLSPHLLTRKPVILMGFGKEEPYHPNEFNRTWKRKAFGMMREFMEEKKMLVLESQRGFPEFTVYADYWDDWITGGYNGFIGGQQAEAWEVPGMNRCQEGMRDMLLLLEKNRRRNI